MVASISGNFCVLDQLHAVAPRELAGLLLGQRAVDLGDELVGEG